MQNIYGHRSTLKGTKIFFKETSSKFFDSVKEIRFLRLVEVALWL